MMTRKLSGLITGLLILAMTAGCSSGSKEEKGAGQTGGNEARYLTVKGSDTMVHLVSTWAEAFMKAKPGTEISVTGGGSGTGIAALINATTDICAASRGIQDKEKTQATAKGVTPNEIPVARDGIAVIVNRENPVTELTVEQIGSIFSGKVTSWKDVGGPDQPILVLSRESSSGTYVFFQEHVMNKADYTVHARFLPGTSAVVQAVTADRWAVGYVGLGFLAEAGEGIHALHVKANAVAPAVEATEASVRAGGYAIARPLFLYTSGAPAGLIKEFVEFCLGPDGQRIVRETGYVTLQ
ncbi:MAG: hypothetical protein A2521_12665 [Deltaproteobacteria bacterium RIFOXYD12_FULL_57_12]|nr:MAG: hypothetical protein A2521_12665 [Deltaproteobacteria bacterium RIFOXYD12_FULL_57_12]